MSVAAAEPSESPNEPSPTARAAGRERLASLAFAAVLVVALGVRLWGLGWQLPWQFHPDEGHYTWKAMDLISQDTLNPKYFRNPSLFTYWLLAQYRLLGFQAPKNDDQAATSDGYFRPPTGVAWVGRLNSALMGVMTVAVVGWIGWRWLGAWTGVLAALLLSLAFIHVRDSHYATNDVPSVLLLMLSVAASASILARPRLGTFLAAGLFGGLATSTKYNAGLFVAPLVVAYTIHAWTAFRGPSEKRLGTVMRLTVPLVVAGVVAALAYLAGTPFTVLDFPKWLADFRTQASFVDEGWEGQAKLAPGLPYVLALGAGHGWVMLLLGVVGLVVLARWRPALAAVLAAYPVTYLIFMLRTELFFVRFALPAAPFVCLFAAVAVVAVTELAMRRGRRLGLAVGAALAVTALSQTTVDTVRHNLLVEQPDTRVLAAQWATANIPAGAKLALEEYSIRDRRPRAYGGPAWQLDTDVLDVNQLRRADPTAPLRGSTRYIMTSSFQQDRFSGAPDSPQRIFYDTLVRDGQMVARFAPGRAGQSIPFDLEDLYTPFWDLARYERMGPTITIYELPQR